MTQHNPAGGKPKFVEQVSTFMRARRYSLRTEQSYTDLATLLRIALPPLRPEAAAWTEQAGWPAAWVTFKRRSVW
jgi:hypothetical protein